MGFDTGPYVSVAAFCDQVIRGDDGALSLIRLIEWLDVRATGPAVPNEIPPGLASPTLVVTLRAGQALGAQVCVLTLNAPMGALSAGRSGTEFSCRSERRGHLVLPLQIEVHTAGLYWANVHINDRVVTRVPLVGPPSDGSSPSFWLTRKDP